MSSCCSVSAKSMICPRLRRVLVGFYSMVTRLGGLALVVLLVAGCGGWGGSPRVEHEFRQPRLARQEGPLPPRLLWFKRLQPGARLPPSPLSWCAHAPRSFL